METGKETNELENVDKTEIIMDESWKIKILNELKELDESEIIEEEESKENIIIDIEWGNLGKIFLEPDFTYRFFRPGCRLPIHFKKIVPDKYKNENNEEHDHFPLINKSIVGNSMEEVD